MTVVTIKQIRAHEQKMQAMLSPEDHASYEQAAREAAPKARMLENMSPAQRKARRRRLSSERNG